MKTTLISTIILLGLIWLGAGIGALMLSTGVVVTTFVVLGTAGYLFFKEG